MPKAMLQEEWGVNLGTQHSCPCTRQGSFRHCLVTVHTPSRNGCSSMEAEVGVDKFCLMALEFELMVPPTHTYTQLLQFPSV